MMKYFLHIFIAVFTLPGCQSPKDTSTSAVDSTAATADSTQVQRAQISDDSLLTLVQYRTFQYFWDGAEPTSGAARERYHSDNVYPENDKHIVTSGGTGFGVMAILVGIERGFITRQQGYERLNK